MVCKKLKRIMRCNKAIRERGIETIEWIAMAAVILTLLAGMLAMATPMGRNVATSMVGKISQWIALWGGGGGAGGGPVVGGSPPGGQPGPGSGPGVGYSPSPVTGPGTGIPGLVGKIVNPGGSGPGQGGGSGPSAPGGGGGGTAGGGENWETTASKGSWKWSTAQVSYSRTDAYVRDANGNWVRDKSVKDNGKWRKEQWKEKVKYGVSFWEAKKTFAEGALYEGEHISLVSYEAGGKAKVGLDNKSGFVASATGKVGAYAAKVHAEAGGDHQFAPGYSVGGTAKGEAWLGAEASGKAALKFGKDGVHAGAGGEAFVGGKAEATGQVQGEIAGVEAAVTGKAGVSYGLGVKGKVEGGLKDGKLSFKTELGATVGLGFNVGVDVNVDVGAAAQQVVNVGKKAVDFGKKAWNSLFSSLPPPTYAQLSPPIRGPTGLEKRLQSST